jgi:hypothetical protein
MRVSGPRTALQGPPVRAGAWGVAGIDLASWRLGLPLREKAEGGANADNTGASADDTGESTDDAGHSRDDGPGQHVHHLRRIALLTSMSRWRRRKLTSVLGRVLAGALVNRRSAPLHRRDPRRAVAAPIVCPCTCTFRAPSGDRRKRRRKSGVSSSPARAVCSTVPGVTEPDVTGPSPATIGPCDAPPHAGQVVRRVLLRRNIIIDAETAQLVAAAVQAALQAGAASRPPRQGQRGPAADCEPLF